MTAIIVMKCNNNFKRIISIISLQNYSIDFIEFIYNSLQSKRIFKHNSNNDIIPFKHNSNKDIISFKHNSNNDIISFKHTIVIMI